MPSAAERQKRYRLHRKGVHTLCDPERRCEQKEAAAVDEAVGSPVRPAEPMPTHGDRGRQLWEAMDAGKGLSPVHRVLLEEACRQADLIDRLHKALDDKRTWLRFDVDDGGSVVVLVDGVLAELRQQITTFRGLCAELRAVMPKEPAKPSGMTKGALSGLADELAARRATSAG